MFPPNRLKGLGALLGHFSLTKSRRDASSTRPHHMNLRKCSCVCGVALFTLCAAFGSHDAPTPIVPHYHIIRRLIVDSGYADFLAVDEKNRRLYGAGDKVFDIDRYVAVGELPPHAGHGFAISPELEVGVARRGVVFDLQSLKQLATLPVYGDAAAYDPSSKRGFFFGDSVTVVDLSSRTVAGYVSLPGKPEGAAADARGHVYVNIVTSDSMIVIDSKALRIVNRWSLSPCRSPVGLAIDAQHERLFASCSNGRIVVVNSRDGRVVASIPVPGTADSFAFDSTIGVLFHPNGRGSLSIIVEDTPDRYHEVERINTAESGPSLALDPVTHRVFLFHQGRPVPVLRVLVVGPT